MSAPAAAPIAKYERIELFDALRGFALAGVLLANLDQFSLYYFLDEAARAGLPTAGFDESARYATRLLVSGKAITLFSLLFGLGFTVQLERARDSGTGLAPYLRRIAVLLLIGCVHTYLLWWGDILLVYALLAIALVPLRHLRDRTLLVAGLALALSWPLLKPLVVQLQPPGLAGPASMYAASLAAFSSDSVPAALAQNIAFANWNRWDSWGVAPFVFAGFLLGCWAGRTRLLHEPRAHRRLLLAIAVVGGLVGLSASVIEPRVDLAAATRGWLDAPVATGLQVVLQRIGPLGMAGAYAAGFALLFQRPAWHRGLRWLAPVGRMALSNYLLQTVLCLALFYGIGLGLGPAGGYPARLAAWVTLFAAQVAISHWWLARHRLGPMEWFWRWAAGARAQPPPPPRAAGEPGVAAPVRAMDLADAERIAGPGNRTAANPVEAGHRRSRRTAPPLHHDQIDFRGTRCVRLRGDGGSALVALHGAHLLSWIPAGGRERLFLSERARYGEGAAIRGGVPVIFPQFAARGPLPKHGFARTLPWRFAGAGQRATFELAASAATAAWPHAFTARLHVGLEATTLELTLEVDNDDTDAFAFTAALHTYLAVDELMGTRLHGLEGGRYEDSADGGARRQQDGEALRFEGEVDRIHPAAPHPIELRDGACRTTISQQGFADTVVWNPGAALAATIGDLAPAEYRHFVCVEAGQVLQPVHLPPGARWSGTQRLRSRLDPPADIAPR